MAGYECSECGFEGELEDFDVRQAEAPDGTRYPGTVSCPICGEKIRGE